jgi:hypothetical protein
MTRIAQLAIILLTVAGGSGCLVRARPVLPAVRVSPAHVHFHGCGHPRVNAVVIVR